MKITVLREWNVFYSTIFRAFPGEATVGRSAWWRSARVCWDVSFDHAISIVRVLMWTNGISTVFVRLLGTPKSLVPNSE